MPFVTSKEMLKYAYKGGYAVGSFNINNLETVQGVIAAGVKTNSPLILQVSQGARKYANLKDIKNFVFAVAEKVNLPIALHLDHGESFEVCKDGVDCGFTSIMIDGSHLPFNENIALTQKVVSYAHERGVVVEGELAGATGECTASGIVQFTNPDCAKEFVFKTNLDSLAVRIGNLHGAFKTDNPSLRFDLLSEIEKVIPNFPLVLHGVSTIPQELVNTIEKYGGTLQGAAGIPADMLKKAAKMGVCKINIDSDMRLAFTAAIRKYLVEHPSHFDPRQYLAFARNAVEEMAAHKMTEVLGCAGKAINN